MKNISHHIPDALMAAYVSGNLPHAYALVVATHISMCDTCRASHAAHASLGGVLLETGPERAVSTDLRGRVLDMLDAAPREQAPIRRAGIFPGPLMEAMNSTPPRWRPLGAGIRQSILHHENTSSVRLLYIPAGEAVPEHGHGGLELTLVLQGAFEDETGYFGVGDLEVADGDLDHQPVATGDVPCICLAATDEPLSFKRLLPRLLQPVFRI
ncbi:MAG: ChrR family anti-sigma-E factor [Rhodobacteraceae bacterium]|nr:ChrR family anti-sigma-E factor [Paracoccaceae bacterium]